MDYLERTPKISHPETPDPPNTNPPENRELIHSLPNIENEVKKKDLINQLNYLNFQNKTVFIHFQHHKYDQTIAIQATPQPCANKHLVCLWQEPDPVEKMKNTYRFSHFTIPNGQNLITVQASLRKISPKGICLVLPDICIETKARQVSRRSCNGLTTKLIQNSVFFSGDLLDFNAESFRIGIQAEPPQTFQWINPKSKVNIIISNPQENLYSGECRILKQRGGQKEREYVLEPLYHVSQRFKPKEYRSHRIQLNPSPDIIFYHPLTQKLINLRVIDMSGSGFSVAENKNQSCLPAGMIIPSLDINFADNSRIQCRAQVVYKKTVTNDKGKIQVKCGLAFLDIDIKDHRRLLSLLHQTGNPNAYISNKVDMDELWKFFFKTGFIYPGKYNFISENKETIKETYKKLYTENPTIATHFIYQEKGSIKGHMSMLRFYEKTWLIHHHAAIKSVMIKAGLVVLDQIGKYICDCCRLHSNHMDYLICYFRPENKFPNHIFGGAARSIQNPKACSLDAFSYSHIRKASNSVAALPEPWNITKPTRENLLELKSFYEKESGGLMLPALDLGPDINDRHSLAEEYAKMGFRRERRLFVLKKADTAKAILMVNITDTALNMSDLTNCIKMIVIDAEDLNREIVQQTISILSIHFTQKKFPLLIYPLSFAEQENIPFEKCYNLWILDPQYSDDYFKSLEGLTKFRKG
ncbi:MAG: PilZ domain-containing protein [Desulfobacteraceae bacterium]|nr:MAG: PilZ domain-containing protein [Desulfobacteraceae bacterium]